MRNLLKTAAAVAAVAILATNYLASRKPPAAPQTVAVAPVSPSVQRPPSPAAEPVVRTSVAPGGPPLTAYRPLPANVPPQFRPPGPMSGPN